MAFQGDYRYMLAVFRHRQPPQLPVYEYGISPPIKKQVLNVEFAGLQATNQVDMETHLVG